MSSLTQGLVIDEEYTVTRITVKREHRVVGIVEGSDERGYIAEYWWPALVDGVWYGPYETESYPANWGTGPQGRANALGWISDTFNTRGTGRALGAPTLVRSL